MSVSNDALIARRRAAMDAKKKVAPVVEDAEVPQTRARVTPLKPPSEVPVSVADDSDDDAAEAPVRSPAAFRRPSATGMALPVADPTRQIDPADIVMPKLRLSQAMSKVNADDVVRQGNYYHSTLNDNLGKSVKVIVVDMRKSRSYFQTGQGVLCRSFDLRQGEGDPGLLCEGTEEEMAELPASQRGCPLRLWGERDASGRSTPPACGINYNYPLLLLDADDPKNGLTRRALFQIRGTATAVARQINSIVTENDLRWHEAVFELGVEQKSNPKGTFFVPTVKFLGYAKDLVSPAIQDRARAFATQVNAAAIRASVEDDGDE